MIRAFVRMGMVLTVAGATAACQTEPGQIGAVRVTPSAPPASTPQPAPTAMDGRWAATDGVFVASFQGGAFTSRFTKTNEILAQGSYRVAGDTVTMEWLSVATQEQRSATCRINDANRVRCEQGGGGGFDLQRTA
jgi:hypothetical protein